EADKRRRPSHEHDRAVRRPDRHAGGGATITVGREVLDPADRAVARGQLEDRRVVAGRALHVALEVDGAERGLVEAGWLEAVADVVPVDVELRLAGDADHVHRLGRRYEGVRIAAGQRPPGGAPGRCRQGTTRGARGGHGSELLDVDLGAGERVTLDLG